MGQMTQQNQDQDADHMKVEFNQDGNQFRVEIPGAPIPKERARHQTRGKYGRPLEHVRTYDPQAKIVKILQMELFITLRTYHRSFRPWTGPLFVNMIFFMPIPKGWPSYKVLGIHDKGLVVWHDIKPDTSNLQKFYEDAFNDILWADDSQIAKSCGEKRYSTNPRTVIECKKLLNPDWEFLKKSTTKKT